jgi:hypothetical protein
MAGSVAAEARVLARKRRQLALAGIPAYSHLLQQQSTLPNNNQSKNYSNVVTPLNVS